MYTCLYVCNGSIHIYWMYELTSIYHRTCRVVYSVSSDLWNVNVQGTHEAFHMYT